MLNIFPTITARRAYYARKAINKAFQKYLELGQAKDAGRVVTESVNTARKWGVSSLDTWNLEILRVFVSVINNVPSSFWLLSYILNDAELLKEIREEIMTVITRKNDTVSMDITKFHCNCPLYVSTWQETLRHISANGAVRRVKTDTLLSNSFALKAGSSIQMPAGVLHQSPSTWGKDARTFNARRFLKANDLPREQRKAQTSSYVSFGGGKHLCPGRHLATTEVLSLVATLLLGYEFEGFRMLPQQPVKIGSGVKKVKGDLQMVVKRREVWKDVTWSYYVGGEVDFAKLSNAEHTYGK
jgi:hypothetical protein